MRCEHSPHQRADFGKQANYSDIASNSGISLGSVKTISHEHIVQESMWLAVPKTLTFSQKVQSVAMSAKDLHKFELEGTNS
jgi:hypothetical protein